MSEIGCGEIWGGIHGADLDVKTSAVEASLYSSACDGGKGGDIYYFSVCGQDMLTRIAIADVTGHGEVVSDTSEWLYQSLKERMNVIENHQLLADLNALAVTRGYKAITTAIVAAIYRKTNSLYFSYAGHHPVMIRRSGQTSWTSLELPARDHAVNLPLGISNELPYEQADVALHTGDLLFLYTDGVIEAKNVDRELFGQSGLLRALKASPGGPKQVKNTVLTALQQHVNGEFNHDDVTFTAVRIR